MDSYATQHSYKEKQLGDLKAAAEPKNDELSRLKELEDIISAEDKEVNRLCKCSGKLKDRVSSVA